MIVQTKDLRVPAFVSDLSSLSNEKILSNETQETYLLFGKAIDGWKNKSKALSINKDSHIHRFRLCEDDPDEALHIEYTYLDGLKKTLPYVQPCILCEHLEQLKTPQSLTMRCAGILKPLVNNGFCKMSTQLIEIVSNDQVAVRAAYHASCRTQSLRDPIIRLFAKAREDAKNHAYRRPCTIDDYKETKQTSKSIVAQKEVPQWGDQELTVDDLSHREILRVIRINSRNFADGSMSAEEILSCHPKKESVLPSDIEEGLDELKQTGFLMINMDGRYSSLD